MSIPLLIIAFMFGALVSAHYLEIESRNSWFVIWILVWPVVVLLVFGEEIWRAVKKIFKTLT